MSEHLRLVSLLSSVGMAAALLRVVWHPSVLCSGLPRAVIRRGQTGGSEWSFSWRTGPWASDPHSGNKSPPRLIHDSLPCCIQPLACVPGGGFESLPAAYSLQALELVCFYASHPPHVLPLPSWSGPCWRCPFPSCSFSLRKTAQVLITCVALLETEPGVGRVRLWRRGWTWANHPLLP